MFKRTIAAVAGLIALTMLAHLPSLGGGFIWDDDAYITENPLISDPDGLGKIFLRPLESPQYYPLVFLSFRIEYRLWGSNPAGYHATNVALHAINALLAWKAASRLLPSGAWLVGAIFALHPVQVESVAWITERKNVLSGFFYLSAMLAYWRFAPPVEPAPSPGLEKGRWNWYLASFLLYLAALGSKTVACSLPAAILLVSWWKRGRIARAEVVPLLPFFAFGLLAGMITSWMERFHVGARGPEWEITMVDRCLIAGRALWFYAGKLAWPSRLTFIYPRWRIDPGTWWQDAYPLAAVAVLAALWVYRGRIGRGPLTGTLFFAGTLFPALGFLDVYPMRYSFVADHFQYLACLGLIVPAAWAVSSVAKVLDRRWNWAGSATVGVLLASFAVATFARSTTFRDSTTLWTDTAAKNPDCWMAYNHLGSLLKGRGKLEESKAQFLAALRIRPDYAKAHYNLGTVHELLGELGPARSHLIEALRIDPAHWQSHIILGSMDRKRGDLRGAVGHFREALRLGPDEPASREKLAKIIRGLGQ